MASSLNYANTLSPKTARSVLVPPDATDVPAAVMRRTSRRWRRSRRSNAPAKP
jgi:hypothetical protein